MSCIAYEGLEQCAGTGSRTLASLEHQWANDRERLTSKHILVIDEAGMIGTRQLERVVTEAERQGPRRSEEHTSELQSLMRISYAVFCLKKKKYKHHI